MEVFPSDSNVEPLRFKPGAMTFGTDFLYHAIPDKIWFYGLGSGCFPDIVSVPALELLNKALKRPRSPCDPVTPFREGRLDHLHPFSLGPIKEQIMDIVGKLIKGGVEAEVIFLGEAV